MLQGYGTHTMNKRNEQRHTRRWEVLQYLNVWGLFRFAQGGEKKALKQMKTIKRFKVKALFKPTRLLTLPSELYYSISRSAMKVA